MSRLPIALNILGGEGRRPEGADSPLPPRAASCQNGFMSKVTNLNQVRKQRARAEKRAAGDANAAKFGRSKAQRQIEAAQTEKATRALDQHLRDRDT